MADLLSQYIGTYTPVTDAAGNIAAGFAGVDWPWLAGATLLIVSVYCVFRLIGAIING